MSIYGSLRSLLAAMAVVSMGASLSGCFSCDDNMAMGERLACENRGFPDMPGATDFPEPALASPWQVCPDDLSGLSDQEIFECGFGSFWQGFSDGRLDQRLLAEERLTQAIAATQGSTDNVSLAKLYNLRGDLRMAMSIENAQTKYTIQSEKYISGDLRKALEVNPGYEPAQAFLDTMVITLDMIFNRWDSAIAKATVSMDRIDTLENVDPHMFTGGAFSVSGTFTGFPMATGLAERTIWQLENAGCPSSLHWCITNTDKAPYGLPGLAYHSAELFARIGDKPNMMRYLAAAEAAPGYQDWAYKSFVEIAVADPDALLAKYAAYGEWKSPLMDVYATSNVGCSFCHGRQ